MTADDTSYRALGVAVLRRAVKDAGDYRLSARRRGAAQDFLEGGPMLEHWSAVAGLSPQAIRSGRQARKVEFARELLAGVDEADLSRPYAMGVRSEGSGGWDDATHDQLQNG